MSSLSRAFRVAVTICLSIGATTFVYAQTATEPAAPPTNQLYVVEIKTGPAWDATKAAHEQVNFREHSAAVGGGAALRQFCASGRSMA